MINKKLIQYTFRQGKNNCKVYNNYPLSEKEAEINRKFNDFVEQLWNCPLKVRDTEFVDNMERYLLYELPDDFKVRVKYANKFDRVKNFVSNYLWYKEQWK